MEADLTRDTFDPTRELRRVLQQQGRVQLDADWNEQASIILHYLEALGADLMGPHGTPAKPDGQPGDGFEVSRATDAWDFAIAAGRYYVDGILCENAAPITYMDQAGMLPAPPSLESKSLQLYLAYLDVWERHLTDVQNARIREVALDGPDTATRSQTVHQLRVLPVTKDQVSDANDKPLPAEFLLGPPTLLALGTGKMAARADAGGTPGDPCVVPVSSAYRGLENQLYRVEVHYSNYGHGTAPAAGPTFKWSRENASVILPISHVAEAVVFVTRMGRDDRLGLQPGDWVEVMDDGYSLRLDAQPLRQVQKIDELNLAVTLDASPAGGVGSDPELHPFLRRWDFKESKRAPLTNGTVPLVEGQWLDLEDGVQIRFLPPGGGGAAANVYRTGDYWLVPARVITGDVEWPPYGTQDYVLARGIVHHYAPLAVISFNAQGQADQVDDRRRHLKQIWQ
jgi:hypothetical protein